MSSEFVDTGFRTRDGPGEIEAEREPEPSEVELRAESVVAQNERLSEWNETVYARRYVSIPGFGESGPGCGEYRPSGVCETCGEATFAPHVCGKRTCPDCWGSWAKESAQTATERVQAFRETEPANHRRQTGHFVFSPEEPATTLRELRDVRTEAKEVAKKKGVRGGSLVLHTHRLTEEALAEYRATEREIGAWVWVREEYGEEWREVAEWAPHVHMIGLMSPEMSAGGEEGDGGVWHLIRTFEAYHGPTDRKSHDEVYGTFRYLLSHAGVPTEETDDGLRSRSWFGELHGSKFSPEEALEPWRLDRLRRVIEEVTNGAVTEEAAETYREEEESLETGECPAEECGGVLIEVMRVDEYLRQAEPPPEVARVMEVCYEYRMGRLQAPPGLRGPSSKEDAGRVIEELL